MRSSCVRTLTVSVPPPLLDYKFELLSTHTHKLKPLNHFIVVPHSLSPLRFNRLWAQEIPAKAG